MAFRSNGGHIAGEDISAYVDEELSPAETSRVYAHLQGCDECRSLADDMRATQTLVRHLPLVRAPRDFTLGPEFDVVPSRQQRYEAPKRSWFNFMPAVAMSAAVLMLLVFADLSSLSFSGAGDSSSGASGSSLRVEDAAKTSAQESANAPQPPPILPRQSQPAQPGTAGGNSQNGFAPTPLPQPQAAGAPATGPAPVGTPTTLLAPAAPPATTGGVIQPPTPTSNAVIRPADQYSDSREDEGGLTTLRILEIIAAVVMVGSLAGLYLQKKRL